MPAAEYVNVQVVHALTTLRMSVYDQPETLPGDTLLFGDTSGKTHHLGQESVGCLQNSRIPLLRYLLFSSS